MQDDLKPLPKWRQHLARAQAHWRRTKDRRQKACRTLAIAARRGLTLAIAMAGATLISYGAYLIYVPAGYLVGGLLLWAIQWNYGTEEGDG